MSDRPPGSRVTRLGKDLLLLSVPSPKPERVARKRGALSAAERKVAELAVQGLANDAIASARGSARRTVANQLASIYAKLGISGRRELRARLHGTR